MLHFLPTNVFAKPTRLLGRCRCLEGVLDCIGADFTRYTAYKALEEEKEEVKMSKWTGLVGFSLCCDFFQDHWRFIFVTSHSKPITIISHCFSPEIYFHSRLPVARRCASCIPCWTKVLLCPPQVSSLVFLPTLCSWPPSPLLLLSAPPSSAFPRLNWQQSHQSIPWCTKAQRLRTAWPNFITS